MDNLSPNQIKQMIELLQKMLPEEENNTKTINPNPIKTINRRPVQTENKFDKMMESHMHKEDIEIDKRLRKYEPTPRVRSFDPIDVTCRVCGKKDSINPTLLSDSIDRYKCNNCSRSAG